MGAEDLIYSPITPKSNANNTGAINKTGPTSGNIYWRTTITQNISLHQHLTDADEFMNHACANHSSSYTDVRKNRIVKNSLILPDIISEYHNTIDHKYNTRKVTDGARTASGIKLVEGKRLMLRCPAGTV
jgi:hypothetical protein